MKKEVFFFYTLYIDYNRRKSGSGKNICIDFLDRIEKKLRFCDKMNGSQNIMIFCISITKSNAFFL